VNRLALLSLALLLAGPGLLPGQSPQRVTLAEAIALATRVDPTVVQAQGTLRSTSIGVRAAKGAYLPSLNSSASGGSSFSEGPARTDPITGQLLSGNSKSQSVSVGLSSELDLFAGFRRTGDLRSAQGREVAAQAGLDDAIAQTSLRTANEFFNALSSRELVSVRQEGVRRADEQLAVAVAKLQTRAANVADSLRAVVQLGEARLALASELARLAAAEAALARRLGLPGRVLAISDSSLAVPGPALDTAAILTAAVASAPAVRRAEANVRAAEGAVTAAKSTFWPRLNLSGDLGMAGSDRDDYTLYGNRRLGLGLSWPLFNRFQREQQVADREGTRDTELARLNDARRQVASDLAAQFAALDAARERIALTRLSVEAARADVAVAFERYRLGAIGVVDLNQSQSGLTRAEEQAVSARFEYLRAKAEIEAILGRRL
jgi:outer membrane protein